MEFYLRGKLYLTLPEAKKKQDRKKKKFMRRCHRCDGLYKTPFRSSKVCPECYDSKAYRQQYQLKMGMIQIDPI